MRSLVKEPVREAVREALAEERALEREHSSDDDGRFSGLGSVLLLAGLAAIAFYAWRRRSGRSDGSGGGLSMSGGDEGDRYGEGTVSHTTTGDESGSGLEYAGGGGGSTEPSEGSGSDDDDWESTDAESDERSSTSE